MQAQIVCKEISWHSAARRCAASGVLIAFLTFAGIAFAQIPTGSDAASDQASQADQSGQRSSVPSRRPSTFSDYTYEPSISVDQPGVFSADKIIEILKVQPELMRSVKQAAADQAQQQGKPMSADDITDDMLFARIRTDADARAMITQQMISQGYVVPADASGMQFGTFSTGRGTLGMGSMPSASTSETRERWRIPLPTPDQNRPPVNLQTNPYKDLPALKDLYAQLPTQAATLRRFGADVFMNGSGNPQQIPMDLPVGPNYVLGPGDNLTIDMWGSVSQRLTRTVDREGKVALPEVGPVVLAGHTLQDAKDIVQRALATQYQSLKVDISVAQLRSVRIYVVGDVQHPGAYDINSMSTPMNALYAAGGPTPQGSMRVIRHFRGQKLLSQVDLYDFLLHGMQTDPERMEPGDTILVPPVGPQVAVTGMVRRPAIYELKSDADLEHVINMAGGTLAASDLGEIKVDRIDPHQRRLTISVNVPEPKDNNSDAVQKALAAFKVQDGDRIMVGSILPFTDSTVYLDGHVFRPGKYPYHKGMTVNELIKGYQDLLPEPAARAELIRLVPPDYHPETIEFKLSDIIGGDDPIELQPFDTVRVLGRYEADAPKVYIWGDVLRPGEYPLSADMTAASLVRMAGGFKRSAFTEEADVASYVVKNGSRILTEHRNIAIGKAVSGDKTADTRLQPFDTLTIHQLAGWSDIGMAVTLNGEVMFPGTYGIHEGEKLSSLIRRAGGFRSTSYPEGSVLDRVQVRELAERSRQELISRIQMASAGSAKVAAGSSAGEAMATMQAIQAQQQQVLSTLRSQPASGRLVIHITSDVSRWENTPLDVELRPSDTITVPKRPNFVLISGQVYNPSAISYEPARSANWYLRQAGGPTDLANRKGIFIIRANGAVVAEGGGGMFHGSVLNTRMLPGDSIVVPDKIIGGSVWMRSLLNTAQVTSSLAIAARVATSF